MYYSGAFKLNVTVAVMLIFSLIVPFHVVYLTTAICLVSDNTAVIGRIKAFADKQRIAVLLVHHVRKMPDSDPFNMVSGSVGIIGAVNSMYVLEKDKRTANKATLHVTGRDVEDKQLLLEFDRDMTVWRFLSYLSVIVGVHVFVGSHTPYALT